MILIFTRGDASFALAQLTDSVQQYMDMDVARLAFTVNQADAEPQPTASLVDKLAEARHRAERKVACDALVQARSHFLPAPTCT